MVTICQGSMYRKRVSDHRGKEDDNLGKTVEYCGAKR